MFSRKKRDSRKNQQRFGTERLESREMLAGDTIPLDLLHLDLNVDNRVTPIDALMISNYANTPQKFLSPFYDLNSDGVVDQRDMSEVTSYLNESTTATQEFVIEGEGSGSSGLNRTPLIPSDLHPSEGEGEGEGCGGGSSGGGGIPTPAELDVDIWRGGYQTQSGGVIISQPAGDPVADGQEVSRGSFTLANFNDTDADGVSDFADNVIVSTNGKGSQEVDLMKLEIHKPNDYDVCKGSVHITTGGTRFWTTSNKSTLAPNSSSGGGGVDLDEDDWAGQSSIILWAEALQPSESMKDIVITVSYRDYPTDTVVATAIWTTSYANGFEAGSQTYPNEEPGLIRTKYSDLIQDPNFTSVPSSNANGYLQDYGGTGLLPQGANPQHQHNSGVYNSMVMRYEVFPTGVWVDGDVNFDITRRIESQQLLNGVLTGQSEAFPNFLDESNDDPDNTDEDDEPFLFGASGLLMLSTDQPGIVDFPTGQQHGDERTHNNNFEEFMRVNVNAGMDPNGEMVSGSRASGFFGWSSCTTGVYDDNAGGYLRKTPINATENYIGDYGWCPIQ